MRKCLQLLPLLMVVMATPAVAQFGNTQIHGFGQWRYGRTDNNHYLGGDVEGDYSHYQFSLSANAQPASGLRVSGLVNWGETHRGSGTEVKYAFADYGRSDAIRFRAGRLPVPFGAYGELLQVGTSSAGA